MVFFNWATMQMAAKIVYYGPGLCGKTSNLSYIYAKTAPNSRGEMVSLETESDRTLFFDLLPIEVGTIGGFKTRLQLYTVPGQVFYNTTRKLVLKGVDGLVFVADSQRPMREANIESISSLKDNLAELGLELCDLPVVLQFNKRDLKSILTIEELNEDLNPELIMPYFESSAINGDGVFETLKEITKLTLKKLRKRMASPQQAVSPRPRVSPAPSRSAPASPTSPAKPVSVSAAALARAAEEGVDSEPLPPQSEPPSEAAATEDPGPAFAPGQAVDDPGPAFAPSRGGDPAKATAEPPDQGETDAASPDDEPRAGEEIAAEEAETPEETGDAELVHDQPDDGEESLEEDSPVEAEHDGEAATAELEAAPEPISEDMKITTVSKIPPIEELEQRTSEIVATEDEEAFEIEGPPDSEIEELAEVEAEELAEPEATLDADEPSDGEAVEEPEAGDQSEEGAEDEGPEVKVEFDQTGVDIEPPPLKRVQVSNQLDILAELDGLRKQATMSSAIRRETGPSRDLDLDSLLSTEEKKTKDIRRKIEEPLNSDIFQRMRGLHLTIHIEDDGGKTIHSLDPVSLELDDSGSLEKLSLQFILDLENLR